ncbi:hypothetical protein TNCT_620151 [Trichonephila clavata]|uniref:Uncharacterized protein n=1 Tax=Trichonephila clavata TaxID=2740835 RepID=A0A8X6KM28_TRICU|nr:hypothetical protein TNCT_620151 [Trichonephila clavata]
MLGTARFGGMIKRHTRRIVCQALMALTVFYFTSSYKGSCLSWNYFWEHRRSEFTFPVPNTYAALNTGTSTASSQWCQARATWNAFGDRYPL